MAEARLVSWPRICAACFSAMRPRQWVKNLFVFAPLLFTPAALSLATVALGLTTFAAFCLAASALYVCNDILDREADRNHPAKASRPFAAGTLSLAIGWTLFAGLALGAGLLAFALPGKAAWVIATYLAANLLYSLRLKQIAILDVITIAIGFVMRVVAGAMAVGVAASPWLHECVGLIALFLAVAKRRDDLMLKMAANHRPSLDGYNAAYLDMCMGMVLGCLLALYIIYSASAEVIARIGTDRLYYTVPFVVAGVMRYLQLTLVERRSGAPTELVTGDPFLLACIGGWLLVFVLLVY